MREAPGLAIWLLNHFGASAQNDAILGDITEQYASGRSPGWFWKQVISAIAISTFREMWNNKLVSVVALSSGWLFLDLTLSLLVFPMWSGVMYSFFVNALAQHETLGWYTSSFLHFMIVFLMLPVYASAGWIVSRAAKEHRTAIVLAFAISVVLVRLPDRTSPILEFLTALDVRWIAVLLIYALGDLLVALTVLFAGGLMRNRTVA
jgi:hypothetical protein